MKPIASLNLAVSKDAQPKAYEGSMASMVLTPGCCCTLTSLNNDNLNGCGVVVAEKKNEPGSLSWSNDRIEVILSTNAGGYTQGTPLLVKPQNIDRVAAYEEMVHNFPKMFKRSV